MLFLLRLKCPALVSGIVPLKWIENTAVLMIMDVEVKRFGRVKGIFNALAWRQFDTVLMDSRWFQGL
jgi:hypothetical protein